MNEQALAEINNAFRITEVLNNVMGLAKTAQTACAQEMTAMVVMDTDECERLAKRLITNTNIVKLIECILDKSNTEFDVYETIKDIVE